MSVQAPGIPHPRIAQRRADVTAAAQSTDRRRRLTLWTALALSLVLLAGYLVTRSELLDVDRLAVTGAARTAPAEIIGAAQIAKGRPLMSLEMAAARERIAELPWIDDVYSTRAWDGTVRFEVTERAPVASVAIPGAWVVVDAEGRVLSVGPEDAGVTVPVIGLNIAAAQAGEWLDVTHLDAIGVAAALYEPIRSAVRAVEWSTEGYVLHLHIPGRVLLGSSRDIEAKLLATGTFLEKVNLHCLDVLDVRAPGTPVLTRGHTCI
jgi:cell division protein FtsQ